MIEITDVQIYVVNEEKLKAYATITLANCFLIRDLKVINGHTGLFIAMPAKKRKDGVFRDIAHPLNQPMREHLEELVLKAYQEAVKEQSIGIPSISSGTEG
jgi:stage V sporulation protein G